jgi:GTP cyclohydrolase I
MERKCDPILGKKVHEHLLALGIETPTNGHLHSCEEWKLAEIEKSIARAMEVLGLDLSDDSLIETPKRVAKMWVKEKFWGLDPAKFPKVTTIENKMRYDEMLIEKNVKVMSDCEHHLVQIAGVAHVGYMPKSKVIGLSKINRVVDYFSRRPQVQERITTQIGEALKYILETPDVAVVVEAKHYCVISRGIEDVNSTTMTSFLGGSFRSNPDVRKEFFSLIG